MEALSTVTWRSVAVYWVLAAVVGLQLHFESRERLAFSQPDQERPRAPLVAVAPESVDAVRVARGSAAVDLVRTQGRWSVRPPARADMSSDLVDALIDSLTTIPPVEVVSEGGERSDTNPGASEYGLDPPHYRIAMAIAGKPVAEVEIGQRNPTRTAVYARVAGDARLYLMGLNAQYYVDLIFEQAERGAGLSR